jgi:hypothetical protein
LFATTPAHTGAATATGPVALLPWLVPVATVPPFGPEPVWLVAGLLPVPQVVFSAATPAQTGADAATGPVTLLRVSLPFEPFPAAALLVPHCVLFAATPAQTGADTATGPVAPVAPVPDAAACAPLLEAQLVLFDATPAHTGAETATGPVEPAWPVLPPVDTAALPVGDDPPTFTPVAELEVVTCTAVLVPVPAVPGPLPVWEALPLTDTEAAGLTVRLPVPPAGGAVLALVLTFDAVETVAPACNWVVLDDAPTGEVVLDVTPADVPAARAAALYRVIPRINPATIAASRTSVLTDRVVLSCIRCSS